MLPTNLAKVATRVVKEQFFKPTLNRPMSLSHKKLGGRSLESKPATTSFFEAFSKTADCSKQKWWCKDSKQANDNRVTQTDFPKAVTAIICVLFLGAFTLAGISITPQNNILPDEEVMIAMMDSNPESLAFMFNTLQVGE